MSLFAPLFGSFVSVDPLLILLSVDVLILPELLIGSLVAVEPLTVFVSLVTLLFITGFGLSFTTLPELLFVVTSAEVLLAVEALFTVLLVVDVAFTGDLTPDEELSPLLFPFETNRALPVPLPYPFIEPRCP